MQINELKKIANELLPIERMFFKYGKGWMVDRLSYLSQKDYEVLKKIIEE